MIVRHGTLQTEFRGEEIAMREMRKHVAWYTAGFPHSSALRNDINQVETLEELTKRRSWNGWWMREFKRRMNVWNQNDGCVTWVDEIGRHRKSMKM